MLPPAVSVFLECSFWSHKHTQIHNNAHIHLHLHLHTRTKRNETKRNETKRNETQLKKKPIMQLQRFLMFPISHSDLPKWERYIDKNNCTIEQSRHSTYNLGFLLFTTTDCVAFKFTPIPFHEAFRIRSIAVGGETCGSCLGNSRNIGALVVPDCPE